MSSFLEILSPEGSSRPSRVLFFGASRGSACSSYGLIAWNDQATHLLQIY